MRMRNMLFAVLGLLVAALPAQAAVVQQTFEFSPAELQFSENNGFAQIYLPGGDFTDRAGWPQVPYRTFHLALPPGARIQAVDVVSSTGRYLAGEYRLFPSQPPQILSVDAQDIEFLPPDAKAYATSGAYPGKLVEPASPGGCAGYTVAGLRVYPVQYEPQNNRVMFYTRIEVAVTYDTGGDRPLAAAPRERRWPGTVENLLGRLVVNPEQAVTGAPQPVLYKSALVPGNYEYVVITANYLSAAFDPLVEWKTMKGVPATSVTTIWIYSNYSGADQAEQIRNFIKDAYQTWGVRWVLLGGDTWLVPHRTAWAMDVAYGGSYDENEIPTDLYYSDLDGTWDDNMNGIYGEVEDNVDLYPEVFVGRATCDDYSEAVDWVTKLLDYEKYPPADYQLNMAFYADVMWDDPFTDGGVSKNLIDELYVPARFDPIDKRYQTLGNESIESVIASLNQGQNIVNHNGHCWIDYMSVANGGLTGYDMDNLTNGSRVSAFMFSIGCWPAAFDYDCVAEHFITNPNGGGVAFIGNSRYGWGSPGNPEYGYSDRYDQQLFKAILVDSLTNLGAALAKAKIEHIPQARQENVYRWCMYETNLLGDPEMPVRTDLPQTFAVQHPAAIPTEGGEYTFTVTNEDNTAPVAGAMVCLWNYNDVYERDVTGTDGVARFTIPPITDGFVMVTATARNFIPYQGQMLVGTGGSYVEYDGHSIDDTGAGNGDGVVNPGETIDLWLTVKNHGPNAAINLGGQLQAPGNPYVAVSDGTLLFGDVPAGATATSSTACDVVISPDCPDGYTVNLAWSLTADGGQEFAGVLPLQVADAVLSFYRHRVDETIGDGNGRPDPGEVCTLQVWVENSGWADAEAVSVDLSAADPMVTIIGGPVGVGSISSGDVVSAGFSVIVDPFCPIPYFVEMQVQAQTGGAVFNDTLVFAVGPTGFADDMESGAPGWVHGGIRDHWMLTDHRTRSGSAAWYCGNPGSWQYEDNMDCRLDVPEVILGPDSRLTFWDWFLVPNYGVDGIHVLITDLDASQTETLDFIGTGGALDSTLRTGNEWVRESYDLSSYAPGTRVRVRLAFSSDNDGDIEEGFYIDDLRIESVPDYDVIVEPIHHLMRGIEGQTVTQRLYIKNTGFWEDSYTLAVTAGDWDATIWDVAGLVEITEIGPVAPGATAVALLKVGILPAAPGVTDTVTVTATSINQLDREAYTTTIVTTEGAKGTIPWLEMIAGSTLDTERWPLSTSVNVRSDQPLTPSPPYIADVRAGGSLLSQTIDLSGQTGTRLAFCYRAYRTSQDYSWYGPCDLYIEYFSTAGVWQQLARLYGETSESTNFAELTYLLPGDALHDQFRLRFRSNNNDVGHWFLDDVYIGPQRDYHFVYYSSLPPGYGAEGEEAVHYLYLVNLGAQPDVYSLATVEGNWTVTFRDDSGEITETGTIASGDTAVVRVVVDIPGGTPAQVTDTTLITVTSSGSAIEWRYAQFRTVCVGSVAAFPWGDDFPTSSLEVEKWPIRKGVTISAQAQAPSPPYTLAVNGEDMVFSQMIDLSAAGEVMLDLYCRAGSNFMLPGATDSIFVEFRTELGNWELIRSFTGGGRYKDEFDRYCDVLPTEALYRGCQLRIRAQSASNSWYLDNIKVVAPPSCAVDPAAIQQSLINGDHTVSPMSISDLGPGELEYRIDVVPTDLLLQNLLARRETGNVMAKAAGSGVSLPGFDLPCDWGGPDDYGYIWIDSDEPYGPVFAWEDISGIGQQLLPISSYLYDTLKLDFAFPYYGASYTELQVSKFGVLQFGPESGINQWYALPMPHSIAPNNVLFWCWGDYYTLGTVYAHSDGERAIIQFNDFGGGFPEPDQSATAQVELAADGRISYRYLHFDSAFPTDDCGIGIENADGSDGFGIVFYVNPLQEDPQYLHENLQIDFYPPPSWINVDLATGTVPPGGVQPVDVGFDAADLPLGTHDAVLRIASNEPDPAANPFYVTARLNVVDTTLCYCPLGDADLNGKITPLDVAILVQYVFRQLGDPLYPPKCDYSTYDVIPDHDITPLDVAYLVSYVYKFTAPPDNPCLW